MKTSHMKTWFFVIILVALTIALSNCKKKEPPPADAPAPQQQAEIKERDRARAERTRARQIKMRQETKRRAAAEKEVSPKPEAMLDEIQDIQAERIYQMARTESKIARKPMMSYMRMVNYCRQLLKEFPNTPQAEKARQLLRNMPEREQQRYNVTAEEMALTR